MSLAGGAPAARATATAHATFPRCTPGWLGERAEHLAAEPDRHAVQRPLQREIQAGLPRVPHRITSGPDSCTRPAEPPAAASRSSSTLRTDDPRALEDLGLGPGHDVQRLHPLQVHRPDGGDDGDLGPDPRAHGADLAGAVGAHLGHEARSVAGVTYSLTVRARPAALLKLAGLATTSRTPPSRCADVVLGRGLAVGAGDGDDPRRDPGQGRPGGDLVAAGQQRLDRGGEQRAGVDDGRDGRRERPERRGRAQRGHAGGDQRLQRQAAGRQPDQAGRPDQPLRRPDQRQPGREQRRPGSDWLGDQDAIEFMCREAPKVVYELEHFGMPFDRNPDGTIYQRPLRRPHRQLRREAGAARLRRGRPHRPRDAAHALSEERRSTHQFFVEWMALDLIRDADGDVVGVTALEMETGDLHILQAKTVLLATGGAGRIFAASTNAFINTGDGLGMAARAGHPAAGHGVLAVPPDRRGRRRRAADRRLPRRRRDPVEQQRRTLHGALRADAEGPRTARLRLALDGPGNQGRPRLRSQQGLRAAEARSPRRRDDPTSACPRCTRSASTSPGNPWAPTPARRPFRVPEALFLEPRVSRVRDRSPATTRSLGRANRGSS